ncbi:G-protein coupled receptor 4-like [Symphorus nematophorus]
MAVVRVRKDHVAPIYVINLLISDLIQLCCIFVFVAPTDNVIIYTILGVMYFYCLLVSVGFMVCIALERYLVIAHPLWYRFRRNIKSSVVVCVLVWVFPIVSVLTFNFFDKEIDRIVIGVLFLLPLPLFIFFLGGTLKALSASLVPSDEKRRIVGVLVLVLLIYSLLFLPHIIYFLSERRRDNKTLYILSDIFIQLSPLADLTLYIFMKKGIIDKLLSSVCCCRMDRMDSDDTNSSSV